MSLLSAELVKLRTTRTTWAVTGVALALISLQVAFLLFESTFTSQWAGSPSDLADAVDQIAGGGYPLALVIGLMAVTTEFRHGTIGRTLQLVPSRTRMMVAKLAASAGYALVLTVLGLIVVAIFVGFASLRDGVQVTFGPEVLTPLWQVPLGLVLVTIFGVAAGALLRNQVVAVTVMLVWMLLVEQIISLLLPAASKWLPFTALSAVFVPPELQGQGGLNDMLAPLTALGVFIGYVAVAVVIAIVLLRRRDV